MNDQFADEPTETTSREPLKRFRFHNECIIEAPNEELAKEEFANVSWGFAADAECEELPPEPES